MRYLTADEIKRMHDRESDAPLTSPHLLDSAVGAPQHTWDGVPLHPTIHDQAAILMRSLAQNHAFADGNKRTAVHAAHAFYGMNGYLLQYDDLEMLHWLIDLATGDLDVEKMADRLSMLAVPIPDPSA